MTERDPQGWDYESWAEAIFHHFFNEENAGEAILFAVDDSLLDDIYGLGEGRGTTSLAMAVKSRIGTDWRLRAVVLMVHLWDKRGGNGAHPALPVLALTVLAASRMAAGGDHASHNYYVPLRRLLDPQDSENGVPGDFREQIVALWESVEDWSERRLEGSHGILKADLDGHHFPYVGLAIQHAFLRTSDLRRLDAFFRVLGLEPGVEPELQPSELRRSLKSWTSTKTEAWAKRLHDACLEESEGNRLHAHCERLLLREARRWDGKPRDAGTGRAVGILRLVIKSRKRSDLHVYAQWDERLGDEVTFQLPDGQMAVLRREGGLDWFTPNPLAGFTPEDLKRGLSEGLELSGQPTKFELKGAEAHVLRYDESIAHYASADGITIGQRHLLLVRSDKVPEVVHFLSRLSEEEPDSRPPADISNDPALADWKLVGPISIDARPETKPPDLLVQYLPTGSGLTVRLVGGLRVGPSPRTYLRGGEPAIGLSEHATEDAYGVGPDGEKYEIPQATTGGEVPLWAAGLSPGRHEIRQGTARVAFEIVDGIAEVAGPGAGEVRSRAGDAEVEGTKAPGHESCQPPRMVLAPRGREPSQLLGRSPSEFAEVHLPRWLSSALRSEGQEGSLSWSRLDAWVDFEPVWQVLQSEAGEPELHLLHEEEPDTGGPWPPNSKWARFLSPPSRLAQDLPDGAFALLQRYRQSVEGWE